MNRKKILAGLLSALTLLGSKASGQPVGIKSSDSVGYKEDKVIKKGTSSKKVGSVPEFSGEAFSLKKESSGIKKSKNKNEKFENSKVIKKEKDAKMGNADKKFDIVQSSMEKDCNLQSLVQSGLSSDVLVRNLKHIAPALVLMPVAGFAGKKIAKCANAPSVKYEYKAPININVDMSPVVSFGKRASLGAIVECWLKCWKEYNAKANNGKTIGALACQDGDESEKALGKSFDDALSKDNWKMAMKIYSKCSSLKCSIMPTVPTGSMFGPMYVYFADNDSKGYKNWDALLDNKDLKVYDVSKYILSDMIRAFTDYLVLSLDDRKKEENINQLLLRIYRFFVVYFHLDIKGISPLGFGLLNGKNLDINVDESGKIVPSNGKMKPYGMSGSLALNAVKSLLWEFFDKACKNESLTVGQFRESMNWLFGWVYYLKWLGESGTIVKKASAMYHVARGERPTHGTDIGKLPDTALGEAKKRNDMINSLFGLVDSNCSVVELLESFSELVKKKDDIHEIAEGDIDKVVNVIDKEITVKGVKPALNKFLSFLSGK